MTIEHKSGAIHLRISAALRRLQISPGVALAVAQRVWPALVGPVTFLLLTEFLSAGQLGYYGTFQSMLGFQSVFDLGLGVLMINLASHEWAQLKLNAQGAVCGEPEALGRLKSLHDVVLRWAGLASLLFVLIIGAAGYVLFSQEAQSDWRPAWLTLIILAGLNLWLQPLTALLEGCQQVTTVWAFRLVAAVTGTLVGWLVLRFHGGLWSLTANYATLLLANVFLLFVKYRNFFRSLQTAAPAQAEHWRIEIWPMQWRLVLQSFVGYLGFGLFTPVIFYFWGKAESGRMALSWMVVSTLGAVALAWLQPRIPTFGALIARRDFSGLDHLFKRVFLTSLGLLFLASLAAWAAVWLLHYWQHPKADKMIAPLPLALFLAANLLLHVSQCLSAYLRAHKREVLMPMGVTASLLCGALVFVLGKKYGVTGVGAGFLFVVAGVIIPWQTLIFIRCRAAWHQ
jgi:hypothetical protein